jgi:single-strand DNA-binding protein
MNTIFLRRVNLGNDAIVKDVENQKVIEFSVAENRKFKDAQGNPKEATTWYRCSMWTSNTSLAEFLKKGSSINIIGKLSASAYLNKSNVPSVDLKISVTEVDLLDKRTDADPPENDQEELAGENPNIVPDNGAPI